MVLPQKGPYFNQLLTQVRQLINKFGIFEILLVIEYSYIIGYPFRNSQQPFIPPQAPRICINISSVYFQFGIVIGTNSCPIFLNIYAAQLTALFDAIDVSRILRVSKQPIFNPLDVDIYLYSLTSNVLITVYGSNSGLFSQYFESVAIFMNKARSLGEWARGPITVGIERIPFQLGWNLTWPLMDSRQLEGFNPYMPQNQAGILTLPPTSAPTPNGDARQAIKPPYPPELPPVVLSSSLGFVALPKRRLQVSYVMPSCDIFVLTNGTTPACLKTLINRPSLYQIYLVLQRRPTVQALPLICIVSLRLIGIPNKQGRHNQFSSVFIVQFLSFVLLLILSHYQAALSPSSNISYVMQQLLRPTVYATSAKRSKISTDETLWEFNISTKLVASLQRTSFLSSFVRQLLYLIIYVTLLAVRLIFSCLLFLNYQIC